jgi:NAD(P)-dependent dehydrogenase (short-subunit alcohol dehydrogenase family)
MDEGTEMKRLEGRVAVVTGSGGIGTATAIRLAEGAEVVIGDFAATPERRV